EPLFLVRRRVDAFLDERLAKRVPVLGRDEDTGGDQLAQADVDIDRRGRATRALDGIDDRDQLVAIYLAAEHGAEPGKRDQLARQTRELARGEPRAERCRRQLVERARVEEVRATRTLADRAALMNLAGEHHEVQRVAVRDRGKPAQCT